MQVDRSGAETSGVKQFESLSHVGSECRLSAADDHRMQKQVAFVDEIGSWNDLTVDLYR